MFIFYIGCQVEDKKVVLPNDLRKQQSFSLTLRSRKFIFEIAASNVVKSKGHPFVNHDIRIECRIVRNATIGNCGMARPFRNRTVIIQRIISAVVASDITNSVADVAFPRSLQYNY